MKRLIQLTISMLICSNAFAQGYDIYVSDAGNRGAGGGKILKYDENGDNPEVFTSENISGPQDIVFL